MDLRFAWGVKTGVVRIPVPEDRNEVAAFQTRSLFSRAPTNSFLIFYYGEIFGPTKRHYHAHNSSVE
jgi:hypothetical protein